MFDVEVEKYHEKGIRVVPLEPGTKSCNIKNWMVIDFYERRHLYKDKGWGVGLSMAEADLVVLDIDSEIEEEKKEYEEFLKNYPTPIMRKGNPIRLPSRFYSKTWQEGKVSEGPLELLSAIKGSGVVCVIPPTKHPKFENVYYEWIGHHNLLNFDLSFLPPLPKEAWEGLLKIRQKYEKKEKKDPNDNSTPSLPKPFPPLPGENRCYHKSYDRISAIMLGHVKDGESKEYIRDLLLEEDKRINPDVSLFLCPSRKEFKKNKTREENCEWLIQDCIKRQQKLGTIKKVELNFAPSSTPIINPKSVLFKEKMRATFPHLTGAGDELFQICYAHSPVQRSRFTAASVISLMSVLMANRYSYKGIQPNLYSILITDQGGGKDFPLRFPRQVLFELGLEDLVGMSNPGSDVALIMNLALQKERIDTIDEATKLFKGMQSTSSSHMSSMAEILNELYTSPCKHFGGKAAQKYQNKNNPRGTIGECYSPYITIISATTFSGFEKTFSEEIFESGLGSRFLYITDDDEKPPRDIDLRFEIPEKLAKFLRQLRQPVKGDNFLNATGKPDLFEMPITEKAADLVKEFDLYCYKKRINKKETTKISSIYSRLSLIMKKIMMIDAVIRNYEVYPTIKVENVEWAINWSTAYIKTAQDFINTRVNSNRYEAELNRVYSVVSEAGEQGILLSAISKQVKGLRNYKELLARLLETDTVIKARLETDRAGTNRYFLSEYTPNSESK